jgi:hypothetical protein
MNNAGFEDEKKLQFTGFHFSSRVPQDCCLPPLGKKNESIKLLTFLHSFLKRLFNSPIRE